MASPSSFLSLLSRSFSLFSFFSFIAFADEHGYIESRYFLTSSMFLECDTSGCLRFAPEGAEGRIARLKIGTSNELHVGQHTHAHTHKRPRETWLDNLSNVWTRRMSDLPRVRQFLLGRRTLRGFRFRAPLINSSRKRVTLGISSLLHYISH